MFSLRGVLGSTLPRGSVPRRRVLSSFLCVVSSGVLCCVVLCHDAEFRDVFFASPPGGQLEMGRITDMVPGGGENPCKRNGLFFCEDGRIGAKLPVFP